MVTEQTDRGIVRLEFQEDTLHTVIVQLIAPCGRRASVRQAVSGSLVITDIEEIGHDAD